MEPSSSLHSVVNSNWHESGDSVRQKRAHERDTNKDPSAKRRKVAVDLAPSSASSSSASSSSEKGIEKDDFLRSLFESLPTLPIDVCSIIRSCCRHPHEEIIERYIHEINAKGIGIDSNKKALQFLNAHKIDPQTIETLEITDFKWERNSKGGKLTLANWNWHPALSLIHTMAPKLKHLSMANGSHFGQCIDYTIRHLNRFKQLETLDLSNIMSPSDWLHTLNLLIRLHTASNTPQPLAGLKTLILVGRSDVDKDEIDALQQARPNLRIVTTKMEAL